MTVSTKKRKRNNFLFCRVHKKNKRKCSIVREIFFHFKINRKTPNMSQPKAEYNWSLKLAHEKIMESGLKRYTQILNEIETNQNKLNELLKTKGFMGLILNDPNDLKLEKEYTMIDIAIKQRLEDEKKRSRDAQLAFVDWYRKDNRSMPINYEKYLWALKENEKLDLF